MGGFKEWAGRFMADLWRIYGADLWRIYGEFMAGGFMADLWRADLWRKGGV